MTGNTTGPALLHGSEGRAGLLHELLALSEYMLTQAEAARWDAVFERERERQRMVWELSAAPVAGGEQGRWNPDLERLLAISRRLTELARAERGTVGEELLKLRHTRLGHRTYRRCTQP
jgi:hypothetical protein